MTAIVQTKDLPDFQTAKAAANSKRDAALDRQGRMGSKKFSQLTPAEKDELMEAVFVQLGLCKEG